MRRAIVQFVAVALASVLALAGCCVACPSETKNESPSSAHNCCPSKQAPKSHTHHHNPDSANGSCPQCIDTQLQQKVGEQLSPKAIGLDAPLAPVAIITPTLDPVAHPAQRSVVAPTAIHAPLGLYLRLSTLLI